jgi:hypothetical protein
MNLSVNMRLRFADGEEAGRITRVVSVAADGEPQSVVVATPGLVHHEVVVPVRWLRECAGGVLVDLDADTLDALDESLESSGQSANFARPPLFLAPGGFSDGGAPGVMSYF